jgi:hypothetical protein
VQGAVRLHRKRGSNCYPGLANAKYQGLDAIKMLAEALQKLLPSQSARVSIVVTLTLLPLAFQAPQFLKPLLWPKATEQHLVVLQLVLAISVGLIGSLITLLFILRHKRLEKSFWDDIRK